MRKDKHISLSEKELLVKLNRGDVEAFNRLFRSFYKPLYFYVFRITGESEASKDILQDVFSQLWKERNNLPIRYSLNGYLYRMARNKSLNYIQQKKREDLRNKDYRNALLHSIDSENQADRKELLRLVDQQVSEFPSRQKQVFLLSRQQGLTHREIAEHLNLSLKTVESLIYRSLRRLKNNLKNFF
ncbi:RNA polymerase sigma-70 factor [Sunxiuqinia elliptica]|uniref:RNA polymerase sigma-70 factor n=1 Tax=Sunxiuqinia elliptica TaxID=655355 RepID=UPI00147F299D|nr:RNA polymerase sigma-70 factor [Sunxiuqinia elliptica]